VAGELVQGLWVGDRLSAMERLSIASFLQNGHSYQLFTYGEIAGVPEGCVVEDARAILPASRIFRYRESPSYAGFANMFRYKLLYERGGWWVDADTVCLKPFDFAAPYVIGSEADKDGRDVANCGCLKAPAGSAAMAFALETCLLKHPADLQWGESGSRLMQTVVARFGLAPHLQPHRVFCPVPYWDWRQVIDPSVDWHFDEDTRAIHLWNEMWRLAGQDKDGEFPQASLLQRLRRRYLRGAHG
jgi:hypothetical protein